MHHPLNLLLVPEDVGLHCTDLVLLVSDQLFQLPQFCFQGLHSAIGDAGREKVGYQNN